MRKRGRRSPVCAAGVEKKHILEDCSRLRRPTANPFAPWPTATAHASLVQHDTLIGTEPDEGEPGGETDDGQRQR
jgi:hypothetical protein